MVRSGNWQLRFGNEASEDEKFPRLLPKNNHITDSQIERNESVRLE